MQLQLSLVNLRFLETGLEKLGEIEGIEVWQK
jgi:hypothetical protein